MKTNNNNTECIIPLWDLENYELPENLHIIEYDADEFIKSELNEGSVSLEEAVIAGDDFHIAMRPIIQTEDVKVCKRTWSISRLLQHAKDTGLEPDWEL
tara:strand:+ start:172 stop:468 length:297 start_codon:yes stop_codon:yes gene_type:complete